MPIHFFVEDIDFTLPQEKKVKRWIKNTCQEENKVLSDLNIIFVSDSYLLNINKKYLQKSYLTDVITFNYNSDYYVSGDIYISLPTVADNSNLFKITFIHEVHRVIIHGLLHLLGYNDKSNSEQKTMTDKENYYLNLFYTDIE